MENKRMRRLWQGPLIYLLLFAIILFMVQSMGSETAPTYITLSYSELMEWVESDLRVDAGLEGGDSNKTIKDIIIQSDKLIGRTEDSLIRDAEFGQRYDFTCVLPSETQFYADVNTIYAGVLGVDSVSPTNYAFAYSAKEPATVPWWVQLLPSFIVIILLVVMYVLMFRQQNGGRGMMNFGKSRANLTDPTKNPVKFDDVAGADEEKEELREIVQFLKGPEKFTSLGAKIPTGVILVGPPGTGKTLLAKAVAGEAGVPFFFISGSDFVEMFVGVGASRVRDLFDQAKKMAPSIIFIDEIDAVGRQRGTGVGGGHDEREQTLNQLLVEMDGFTTNQGVIVIAATNRVDVLDPALLRPGRFDRRVTVNYPDVVGREAILKVHSRNKPLGDDVDLNVLARRTPYFTGADLMNVMNESALLAAREGQDKIHMPQVEEAITRVMAGPEKKSRRVTEADRRLVAYHEGGHAIVSYYIPECDPVHEITTIPRGSAGGYTMYLPQEEFNFVTVSHMKAEMASLMGGRVAEDIVFGDVTTGASSDIKRATEMARGMVTEYGMSDKLGPVYLGSEHEVFLGRSFAQQGSNISETVSTSIDSEVHDLLTSAYNRAKQILTQHRDQLDGLAALLIEREKLDRDQFNAFMQTGSIDGKSAFISDET